MRGGNGCVGTKRARKFDNFATRCVRGVGRRPSFRRMCCFSKMYHPSHNLLHINAWGSLREKGGRGDGEKVDVDVKIFLRSIEKFFCFYISAFKGLIRRHAFLHPLYCSSLTQNNRFAALFIGIHVLFFVKCIYAIVERLSEFSYWRHFYDALTISLFEYFKILV